MEEDEKRQRQEEQTVRRGVEHVKLAGGDAEPLGRIVPPQVITERDDDRSPED
jgi:hypothetical protein